jgi:hypothetical protein
MVLFFGRSFYHQLENFETIFLENFGEHKTPTTLVLDLSRIKMESKEKIKYFNQCFLTLLKQIPQALKPVEDVTIEFYTSSLPMSMVMFFKNVEKTTLEATFKESLKIEKNMLSLKGNPGVESSKEKTNPKTKSTATKTSEEKKDTDSMDMEALQRIVKKLSNEIIDLKKNSGEGSSNPKKFFKFQPKKDKNTPPTNKTNSSGFRWY